MLPRYRIAAPDEYLAVTGMGIKNTGTNIPQVKITKATWVMPFQRCFRFSVHPHDYPMNLQAMTKEKLQVVLPVVFTIGPNVNKRGGHSRSSSSNSANRAEGQAEDGEWRRDDDAGDALMKYAMLLADSKATKKGTTSANDRDFLENIVKGIIEGEVRVLVSSMTMEEIFSEREVFKRRIFRNIQGELDQFGLKIFNANVKELKDAPNSVYFESLSRKAHEGATNQARIDVAEAQLRGTVGEARRKGEQEKEIARIKGDQEREIAKIHAETAVQKTERDIERAQAEAILATRKTELDRDVEIARIHAKRKAQAQDEELKREVETKRAAAELERLRATDVVKATISREAQQQAADAKAYEVEAQARAAAESKRQQVDADAYKTKVDAEVIAHKTRVDADAKRYQTETDAKANFEKQKQQADADVYKVKVDTETAAFKTKLDAEAWCYATVHNADAKLQKTLKEAEGLKAMAEAYAKMADAFGGPAGLLQYMMIEKGTYVELAKANAEAIRGLQPKISVWNTGPEAGTDGPAGGAIVNQSSIATMRNIYQMLPPLMTTINEQTGISLPEWQFGRLAGQMSQLERGEIKPNHG